LIVILFAIGKNFTLYKALLLVIIYLGFILFVAIEVMNYSIF